MPEWIKLLRTTKFEVEYEPPDELVGRATASTLKIVRKPDSPQTLPVLTEVK